jgi:two-component system, chemotaxis family, chemotaxis protein CheY
MTILTVDDSSSIRAVVRFTLEGAGYHVIEACDGQEALEKLIPGVRLVLTDLNMPRLDGIEVVRHIRANPDWRGLPIVMLTTESQDGKKQAGRAAGATGWIVKPFKPEQLLAVVKKVLG